MDRRNFIQQSGFTAAGLAITPMLPVIPSAKTKIAMVGTGHRGIGMWGTPVIQEYMNTIEFAGLCDINPGRVETAKKMLGLNVVPVGLRGLHTAMREAPLTWGRICAAV
ncbi:MAG: hypothetical protein H7Y31_11635, partial [Chitinophagaceae bacterium]|nr:hypothetical protein [Chitinophagaceae bacterium]